MTSKPKKKAEAASATSSKERAEAKPKAVPVPDAWNLAMKTAPFALSGEENAVYSPACIYEGLRALRLGAEGETARELDELLGANWESPAPDWMGLGENDDRYAAHVASALWLDNEAEPSQEFINACEARELPVQTADLSDPEAGPRITQWVSDHTEGLLAPAVKPDASSLACLATALYLKDGWRDGFCQSDSQKEPFHTESGDVETTFMVKTANMPVLNTSFGTLISLPLEHGADMVFALPNEDEDLSTPMASGEIVRALSEYKPSTELVELHLPKFTCETDLSEMTCILERAGFETSACPELFPMTGARNNSTTIAHSARIAIDEEGLEAAASIVAGDVMGIIPLEEEPPKPRLIKLNRPFAFGVISKANQPLFLGTLTYPEGEDLSWVSLWEMDDGNTWLQIDEEIPGVCRLTEREGDLADWHDDNIEPPEEIVNKDCESTFMHRYVVEFYGRATHTIWIRERFTIQMRMRERLRSELRNYALRLQKPGFDADAWVQDFTKRWK